MQTLTVELGDRSYPIYIGAGLLKQRELLTRHIPGRSAMVVTNTTVAPLYLGGIEHTLANLPNGRHLVGTGQGHGMFARGCTPQLMEEFIESGDASALDVSCLDRLQPAPFFLRFTGPDP